MMELTRTVAQLCHDIDCNTLPEDVKDRVKYLLLDYLGVAIRGSKTESSIPVHRLLSKNNSKKVGVPVIATHYITDAPYAALALGTAAHSLELDDVVNSASLHPAVTVMSAALSSGYLKECSGRELIESIVAGYEVTVKLGIALNPASHYAQGFHPTGTCGTFGAAVTTAKLLKLDAAGITNAMGIAGSQASGSMEFLADGSFTKRFHAGWAAHSGVMAAFLAEEGFTGPGSIIEGKFGFLHSYSGASDSSKILKGWGAPYEVMNTSIKPHACCRYKQGAIDCILKIMEENQLTPDQIERVDASILQAGFDLVAEPRDTKLNPRSVVDAQFSMPFGGAVAILKRNASLDQYSMENVSSSLVKELMPRIHCRQNQAIEKEYPNKWPADVEITVKDGKRYFANVEHPKGDPENPLSWDEIIQKFRELTGPIFSPEKCSAIVDHVQNLENIKNIRYLVDQICLDDTFFVDSISANRS